MNFHEYQQKSAKFASKDLQPDVELATWALGLTGEAGEVADLIKKNIGHGHPLDRLELAKELGDVLWYIAQVANYCDLNLEAIAVGNINKLENRYPEGFSSEASINRVD